MTLSKPTSTSSCLKDALSIALPQLQGLCLQCEAVADVIENSGSRDLHVAGRHCFHQLQVIAERLRKVDFFDGREQMERSSAVPNIVEHVDEERVAGRFDDASMDGAVGGEIRLHRLRCDVFLFGDHLAQVVMNGWIVTQGQEAHRLAFDRGADIIDLASLTLRNPPEHESATW